jgi:hypothetical protein
LILNYCKPARTVVILKSAPTDRVIMYAPLKLKRGVDMN